MRGPYILLFDEKIIYYALNIVKANDIIKMNKSVPRAGDSRSDTQ